MKSLDGANTGNVGHSQTLEESKKFHFILVSFLTVINYGARLENFEGVWMTNSQPRQPGQELGSSAVPGHYS